MQKVSKLAPQGSQTSIQKGKVYETSPEQQPKSKSSIRKDPSLLQLPIISKLTSIMVEKGQNENDRSLIKKPTRLEMMAEPIVGAASTNKIIHDSEYFVQMLNKMKLRKEKIMFLDIIALKLEAKRQHQTPINTDHSVKYIASTRTELMVKKWLRKARDRVQRKRFARDLILNDSTSRAREELSELSANSDNDPLALPFNNIRSDLLREQLIKSTQKEVNEIASLLTQENLTLRKKDQKTLLRRLRQKLHTQTLESNNTQVIDDDVRRRHQTMINKCFLEARETLANDVITFVMSEYQDPAIKALFIDKDCNTKQLGGLMKRHKKLLAKAEEEVEKQLAKEEGTTSQKGSKQNSIMSLPRVDQDSKSPTNRYFMSKELKRTATYKSIPTAVSALSSVSASKKSPFDKHSSLGNIKITIKQKQPTNPAESSNSPYLPSALKTDRRLIQPTYRKQAPTPLSGSILIEKKKTVSSPQVISPLQKVPSTPLVIKSALKQPHQHSPLNSSPPSNPSNQLPSYLKPRSSARTTRTVKHKLQLRLPPKNKFAKLCEKIAFCSESYWPEEAECQGEYENTLEKLYDEANVLKHKLRLVEETELTTPECNQLVRFLTDRKKDVTQRIVKINKKIIEKGNI